MTGSLAAATGIPSPVSSAAMACQRSDDHCCKPGRILSPADKIGFLVCLNFVWTQSLFAIMVSFPGTEHLCCGGQVPWRSQAAGQSNVLWSVGLWPCCSLWACPFKLQPCWSPRAPHCCSEMFLKGAVDFHVLHVAVFIFTG